LFGLPSAATTTLGSRTRFSSRETCDDDTFNARDVVLRMEAARAQPLCATESPLVRADVFAMTILDSHRNDGFFIRQLA
jgi:hypothetical protein